MDYLFVLRPTLFFPVWTVFLANYYASTRFDTSSDAMTNNLSPFNASFLITLLMGSVFIINQIVDIETDKKNNKLFIIADGYISIKNAVLETLILAVLPFAVSFYINMKLGIIFLLIFFSTCILYNIEPFAWKDKPIL